MCAGGDEALIAARESAEDNPHLGTQVRTRPAVQSQSSRPEPVALGLLVPHSLFPTNRRRNGAILGLDRDHEGQGPCSLRGHHVRLQVRTPIFCRLGASAWSGYSLFLSLPLSLLSSAGYVAGQLVYAMSQPHFSSVLLGFNPGTALQQCVCRARACVRPHD